MTIGSTQAIGHDHCAAPKHSAAFVELADGIEHGLELYVVFILQRGQLSCQFHIQGKHLAQEHEGAHDLDVYLNGTRALQNAGQHGDTLFRESVGRILPMSPASCL